MARRAREKSETGIYHIMLRGIDKRNIFLDNNDKEIFLYYLFRAKELGNFKLYAYCLMDNHVHLLIEEGEDLATSIKRIAVGYVQNHNNRHGRVGHLFQNRYRSEAVTNDSYLIAVVRYIHQNPLKAKLVKEIDEYQWSSYGEYLLSYNQNPSKIDTELIISYFSKSKSFEKYMKELNDDKFLDYEENIGLNDKEIRNIIKEKLNGRDLSKIPKEERNKLIKDIYESTRVSIRKLSKFLGISRSIIDRAIKL